MIRCSKARARRTPGELNRNRRGDGRALPGRCDTSPRHAPVEDRERKDEHTARFRSGTPPARPPDLHREHYRGRHRKTAYAILRTRRPLFSSRPGPSARPPRPSGGTAHRGWFNRPITQCSMRSGAPRLAVTLRYALDDLLPNRSASESRRSAATPHMLRLGPPSLRQDTTSPAESGRPALRAHENLWSHTGLSRRAARHRLGREH